MAAVEPAQFRRAMGLIPTPVTVVTAAGSDGPAGATANAVSSLSLEPMLMLACLDRGSRTLLAVQAANSFGVNVLGAGQEDLARAFSTKAPVAEKWEGVGWSDFAGVPALDGAIVRVACELQDVIAGGDHVIVTGAVIELEVDPGPALVFHGGVYSALDLPEESKG
jgi:flavin reductase (DIM6/NTAB) family NADH-FMN oxidoreductase RutF